MHPNLKKCTKCNQEKPATTEFFYWRNDTNKFKNDCKPCKKAHCKKYYENNLEKRKAYNKKYRQTHPDKMKANNKKHYEKNSEKVKAQAKKWAKNNPDKVKTIKKKYYQKNSEKVNTRIEKYRQNNPEKVKAGVKKYYQKNSEKYKVYNKKYYLNNPEKVNIRAKKWAKNNPDKVKTSLKKHAENKLAKFAAGYKLTKREVRFALYAWSSKIRQNPCVICGNKADHAHHILYTSNYPKLALNLNNGIPLCLDHHEEVHHFDFFTHLIKARQKN